MARIRRIDGRIVAALLFLLIAAGLAIGRTRGGVAPSGPGDRGVRGRPAPDFRGIPTWINSPPLTVGALHGKVVLVDFWTYSCINCIRTLPFLKAFYARYQPFGLEIVGVHSPEFSFEKVEANVRDAVRRHGVVWPVAMDSEMKTWQAYGNHYWPHVYLLDRSGRIRFDFIGEGHDEEIETRIRDLLRRPGVDLPAPAPLPNLALSPHITPEVYLGSLRGSVQRSLGNPEGYRAESTFRYPAPLEGAIRAAGTGGRFFLAGAWTVTDEAVVSAEAGARIILPFRARDVFVVGGPEGAGGAADVLLDGRPIAPRAAGAAVRSGSLAFPRRDLFQVAHLGGVEEHVLTIVADAPGLALYSFTFG